MYTRTRAGRKRRNSQIVQFEKYWKPNKFCKANYVIEHDFIFKRSYLKDRPYKRNCNITAFAAAI